LHVDFQNKKRLDMELFRNIALELSLRELDKKITGPKKPNLASNFGLYVEK